MSRLRLGRIARLMKLPSFSNGNSGENDIRKEKGRSKWNCALRRRNSQETTRWRRPWVEGAADVAAAAAAAVVASLIKTLTSTNVTIAQSKSANNIPVLHTRPGNRGSGDRSTKPLGH